MALPRGMCEKTWVGKSEVGSAKLVEVCALVVVGFWVRGAWLGEAGRRVWNWEGCGWGSHSAAPGIYEFCHLVLHHWCPSR